MDRYKKKSLRFSGCGLSKAVRALEQNESRKSSRSELLNVRRNIKHCDGSLISTPEPVKETTVKVIAKPLSRLEQLKKWRDEKALKKKVEEMKKPPPFVVGTVKYKKDNLSKPNSINFSSMNCTKNSYEISKNVSTLRVPKNTSCRIPKNTSSVVSKVQTCKQQNTSVVSKIQTGKQQVKTGIPKVAISRIPSSRQVTQESSRIESRIPSFKPGVQKVGVKENVLPVGKCSATQTKIGVFQPTKSIAGLLQKPSANTNKKILGRTAESLKVPVGGKKIEKEMAPDKEIKKEPVEKRLSFAPENFKFVPDLPMINFSAFEGLCFSRKTDSKIRTSTPIKATPPPLPSPKSEKCIETPLESKVCCNISNECADEKENKSVNIKEISGKENTEEREVTFDNITANDEEIGDKNITRRTTKPRKNIAIPECIESDMECISDFNMPTSFPLFNITEEFETSSLGDTPKSHMSSGIKARRSLRLLEISKNKAATLECSPLTKTPIKGNSVPACHADLSEAFSQLNVNSINLEKPLELPIKGKKQKKVSLLYTPEQKRYSLRKSVRGDLISFS